jgi:hypothetical protein
MEPGYAMDPAPIGRETVRRMPALVAAVAIFLALVVAKPWDGPTVPPRVAIVAPRTAGPVASPALAAHSSPAPVDAVSRAWPAAAIPIAMYESSASQAEGLLGALARHSGSWGVGNAGVGPRLLRDEPWADWAAVAPEAVGNAPTSIATRADTGVCEDLPAIYDRPSVVAVTAPADLVPDRRLVGWWTDGRNVADLVGSIRQVSSAGRRGISYRERTDRAPWPPGRYEFHLIEGGRSVALTVCLARGG